MQIHLTKHLEEYVQGHLCEPCSIGFANKTDLEHHILSVKDGTCGFAFPHATPCTGHHPPASSTCVTSALTDHDRFKFGSLVQCWEGCQLQVREANVQELVELRDKAEAVSHFSLPEELLLRRNSLASLVFSLKSFRSEQEAKAWDEEHALADISRRLGTLSVRTPFAHLRQRKQKLKELELANAALGPAASCGDDTAVALYLTQGANVDALSRQGGSSDLTPLMLAASGGHHNVAFLLVKHGAGIDLVDATGETALQKACMNGSLEIVSTLVNKGPATNVANVLGETALHVACKSGHKQIVRTLIAAGASVRAADHENRVPLVLSVLHDRDELTRFLIEELASTNSVDVEGTTLLHMAAEHNSIRSAQVLLDFGVDPNGTPSTLWMLPRPSSLDSSRSSRLSPLDIAMRAGFREMASILRAAGGTRKQPQQERSSVDREQTAEYIQEMSAVSRHSPIDRIQYFMNFCMD